LEGSSEKRASSAQRPLVFVTVGTDHHPFDRLVRWIDQWSTTHHADASCFIQNGTSARPEQADWADYLPYAEMEATIDRSSAVVCHGGPGTIMLCSYRGKKPIVVPRQSSLGEHVDDHQIVFSRRLAAEGEIELAETEGALRRLLDRVVAGEDFRAPARTRERIAEAVERFEELVTTLVPAETGGV
jgi:UDP-N-acetylglucosamine transferase subunit ALG13